jgi:hypothetical protein
MYLAKQAHRLALPTPSGAPRVVEPRGARFPRASGRGARR